MIKLKEVDLTEIKKKREEIEAIRRKLHEEEVALNRMINISAADYYGIPYNEDYGFRSNAEQTYFKSNGADFTTDDGYVVKVEDYNVHISKKIENGTLRAHGTRYDRQCSDLNYYLQYDSGRTSNSGAEANKYTSIRARMTQICDDYRVFNPYKNEGERY